MKYFACLFLFTFFLSPFVECWGQIARTRRAITVAFQEASLLEITEKLEEKCDCRIFLAQTDQNFLPLSAEFQDQSVEEILSSILANSSLSFLSYDQQLITIGKKSNIARIQSAQSYQILEENIEFLNTPNPAREAIGSIENTSVGESMTLRGTVRDEETGEGIAGASVILKPGEQGAQTDDEGNYSLEAEAGAYDLMVQYIGYRKRKVPIRLISSGKLDVSLIKADIQLDAIVLEAYASDGNVESNQTGLFRINMKELEKLPHFLGEVDVVKSLLLQPGVSSIGEGSSGFNVRGGNTDQNLVLLDEAILFNSSHALGFFSSFNADIVQDATLYKGNIPAKFGGRISSVLDVGVKEGNYEEIRIKGGLGLVSSRLMIEGPLKKNKTSFLVSGRSSYSDWLLNAVRIPEVKASSAFFYDANLKLTHRFDDRNIVSLSLYQSKDKFSFNEQFGFDYQSSVAQLSYQRFVGKHALSSFYLVYGDYQSNQDDLRPSLGSTLSVGNTYWKAKENFNLSRDRFSLDAGVSAILYQVNPGELRPNNPASAVSPRKVEDERGLELTPYLSGTYEFSSSFSLNAGLRFTHFRYLGPGSLQLYENPEELKEEEIIGIEEFGSGTIYNESKLEPRVSLRFKLDPQSSLKFSYTRSSQFINQISNTETPLPTDIWQLTSPYIPPHLSHNFSLGYFRNFDQNKWISSLDLFYRNIDQLFDYKDFANLISNDHIETELLRGIGRSRGVELSIKKQLGFIHGWFSYTFSRTERKVQGINEGEWYPATFDKPHEASLVTNIQISKRSTISINFNYASGRPITIPVDRHLIDNRLILLNFSERNAFRIPDYHRLDLSYTLSKSFRKSQKLKSSWTFSIYNVYGRRNPFAVFVDQAIVGDPKIQRLSILGSAFPSLTINIEL